MLSLVSDNEDNYQWIHLSSMQIQHSDKKGFLMSFRLDMGKLLHQLDVLQQATEYTRNPHASWSATFKLFYSKLWSADAKHLRMCFKKSKTRRG